MFRKSGRLVLLMTIVISTVAILSCSTQKNTGLTRTVHSIKAHYNTFFNGQQAYKEGYDAQRKGNDDNFMELIPFYMTGNKATRKLGKGNYDKAIEKSKKSIKQHSITKKPELSASQRRKPKGQALLQQREYNPFLYKAWFLLGQAQMQEGEYMEAASTFAYIQRLYPNKPNIMAQARLLEARCYSEMEWHFDAENIINELRRDSFPEKFEHVRSGILADINLQRGKLEDAIPYVLDAAKHQKGATEAARLYFLLGQLYQRTDQKSLAYKAFQKVISKNPPYELEFNARIQQTSVMSQGQSKQMIAKLKRMAKDEKNKDYLDQVYYAIGNIYLAQKDTAQAIDAYCAGVEKSTRSSIEKGIVWLNLGRLYWDKEKFVKAQECYSGALGLFDKEHDDYKELDERSHILEDLLPHATAVELQDSLQTLARMDSVERLKVIDKIIEDLKKKEKEEARKMADAEQNKATQEARQLSGAANAANGNRPNQPALWYFYNPTAVAAGKLEFKNKWGNRELADDWRRKNKTVLADNTTDEDGEVADSTMADSTAVDSLKSTVELTEEQKEELEKMAEYEADPHRPEYYLKDIPLTEEKMAASNAILVKGLYNSAIIYKDQMENFPLAERTFRRVYSDFPDYEHIDETYYNLFQLYSRTQDYESANSYKELLLSSYPDNPHAKLISDPDFEFKGRYGKMIEDSLYQDAYDAYVRDDFNKVVNDADLAIRDYPEGDNRARFMFLRSMSKLNLGESEQFMSSMREIVEKYPKSTVSELAGLYVKGLTEGRLLAGGKMNNGSIWERRISYAEGTDSLAADTTFSDEKNCDWSFIIAYEHDSINENQLLYEVARYNFSSFSIRNFNIEIVPGEGIDILKVNPFLNYDEAYIYLHKLVNDEEMAMKLEGLKLFIISEDNLKKIMRGLSYADYFDFYDSNFDRIGKLQIDERALDEPTDIPDPEEQMEMEEDEEEEYGDDEENFIF